MIEMAKNAIVLCVQGRLFAHPGKVYRQLAIGISATAIILFVAASIGAPPWIAALGAGLLGGALQPYLFRNLRYR